MPKMYADSEIIVLWQTTEEDWQKMKQKAFQSILGYYEYKNNFKWFRFTMNKQNFSACTLCMKFETNMETVEVK